MSHCACCHTCYTIQLMHYSHPKTQSLQHLKPLKCYKRVCKYKTPTCFSLFSRPSSGGSSLCFVPLLFLLTSRSPTDKNTKHTQMTYTCGHILRNNTNSTNANQREEQQRHKAQRRTPWRWSWKKTETCRGFILTNTFLTFYWF